MSGVPVQPLRTVSRPSNRSKPSHRGERNKLLAKVESDLDLKRAMADVDNASEATHILMSGMWEAEEEKLQLDVELRDWNCADRLYGGRLQSTALQMRLGRPREELIAQVMDVQDLRVIIDSGASGHMFPTRDVFYLLKEYAPNVDKMVMFGGGSQAPIIGIGDTCLVKDALYVPGLTTGVISVSKLDRSGYITVIGGGTLEVETFREGNTVIVGELEDESNLYELTDMYKRMLLSWDCRVYPKDVNEDILDEDGTWTRNYDDESTESSSTASTYENVEESIDDDDKDDYTDDTDEENMDIHVESKIDHLKKAKRRKKQDYKFRNRMSKWQRLHESYGKNVNDYALKAKIGRASCRERV
jgi:hypothetical protein